VIQDLPPTQVPLARDLAAPARPPSFEDVPRGMRAVAVLVAAEDFAGGRVLPGSRIDVLRRLNGGADGKAAPVVRASAATASRCAATSTS
jgi:Flp pilus assembly protein CpaB